MNLKTVRKILEKKKFLSEGNIFPHFWGDILYVGDIFWEDQYHEWLCRVIEQREGHKYQ